MLPDNYDLFKRHQSELDDEMDRLPVCDICEEPIQDERCYQIGCDVLCKECLEDNYGMYVDELMED